MCKVVGSRVWILGCIFCLLLAQQTEPHFIRCLKPNETKRPLEWEGPKVLNQLFSLSILEALQLRQIGYSYRRPFAEFVKRFRWLELGAANSNADRKEVALQMLQASGLPEDEWAVRTQKKLHGLYARNGSPTYTCMHVCVHGERG